MERLFLHRPERLVAAVAAQALISLQRVVVQVKQAVSPGHRLLMVVVVVVVGTLRRILVFLFSQPLRVVPVAVVLVDQQHDFLTRLVH
jgi:hypothetical protein